MQDTGGCQVSQVCHVVGRTLIRRKQRELLEGDNDGDREDSKVHQKALLQTMLSHGGVVAG